MSKLFALKGKIQNFAWGGTQFISNLLGLKPTEEKCAEYWLGAHANAPSVLPSSPTFVGFFAYSSKSSISTVSSGA